LSSPDLTVPATTGSEHVALVCCELAGTIVSDGSVLERAFAEAIATQGVVAGTAAYARSMVVVDRSGGLPPRDVMHTLFVDDAQAQAAYLAFERSYRMVVDRFGLATVPGAQDTLAKLAGSRLQVCLVSGFSRPTSRLMLERLGISRHVDLTLCLDDAPHGFPRPDLVLTAVLRLGIEDVASVAVVGNSEPVITGGRRAGARTLIGIPGHREAARLRAAGATHLINSIAELPALLR
jgi:phosphoglycolate phosphatase